MRLQYDQYELTCSVDLEGDDVEDDNVVDRDDLDKSESEPLNETLLDALDFLDSDLGVLTGLAVEDGVDNFFIFLEECGWSSFLFLPLSINSFLRTSSSLSGVSLTLAVVKLLWGFLIDLEGDRRVGVRLLLLFDLLDDFETDFEWDFALDFGVAFDFLPLGVE